MSEEEEPTGRIVYKRPDATERAKRARQKADLVEPAKKRPRAPKPKAEDPVDQATWRRARAAKPTPEVHEGDVLVFRRPDSGRPVAVPTDVVMAAERPYRAYCARLSGMGWEAVALQEGYPNAVAAAAEVNRYLESGKAMVSQASAGALITLELDRLNALQAAIWESAMEGNLPAVSVSMNLVLSRVKLLGLDFAAESGEGANAPRTVVVPMDSAGYVAALQEGTSDG